MTHPPETYRALRRRRRPLRLGWFLFFGGVAALIFLGVLFLYRANASPEALAFRSLRASQGIRSYASQLDVGLNFTTANGPWGVALESSSRTAVKKDTALSHSDNTLRISGPEKIYNFDDIRFDILVPDAETLYLKLKSPKSFFIVNLEPILNQWLKIRFSEFQNTALSPYVAVPFADTADWQNVFIQTYRKHRFLRFEYAPEEKIDGEDTDHIRFRAINNTLLSFAQEYFSALAASFPENEKKEGEAHMMSVYAALKGHISRAEIFGEAWLGKKDRYARKLLMYAREAREGNDPSLPPDLSLRIIVNFRDFHSPVDIRPPENFQGIDEAFKKVTGFELKKFLAAPPKITVGSPEPESDSDQDGLFDAMEIRLKTDPKNPDTDGDGYGDGVEFNSGYNPLGGGKL